MTISSDLPTKTYFFYILSSANSVLGCTQEGIKQLFPNSDYCELKYYRREDDFYETALEVRIDGGEILCHFDENDNCNSCYVYFDKLDDIDSYIELCNTLFGHDPTLKHWRMQHSYFVLREERREKYFAFFKLPGIF